ncbi:MAG: phosphoglucomutase/phosphomannomutase family protein [Acidobacteria bacterium]|nr:phosphoglucomutase/phosphomannomutase family protein [Acidobacteriota bacterium]MCW5949534.1 phosphoglucomutase/phosphomannomutase family protein [Pyrinomonadaceae bacterium]
MSIRFGTSGWRAVIAEEFTFDNVSRVTEAICSYLTTQEEAGGRPIIVGHDSRFMGEKFAEAAANIASAKGFKVLRCIGPTPTPAISFAIRSREAAGGLNFTASHNPPEYQGIKFSTADGAPALPEVTKQIEHRIANRMSAFDSASGSIEDYDACPDYLADLAVKVDLSAIARSGAAFAYDPLWGTGRGYLDRLLREAGVEVETLHDWRDVTFGGRSPEPGEKQLEELTAVVLAKKYRLGLATDGDGDRFGVIDSDGTFITANQLIALLTDYLIESRGWELGVARSVATTHQVDRVARARGVEIFETPVGFKFIGELINEDRIVLGGEESAGLSIRGHYPEKDGLLACLLAAEAVAVRGATLGEQLAALYERDGRLYSGRIGVKLTPDVAASLKKKLDDDPEQVGGRRVGSIERMDGVKFLFEADAWMLMRPSGTEPMVRIYAEAGSETELGELLKAGQEYLLGS